MADLEIMGILQAVRDIQSRLVHQPLAMQHARDLNTAANRMVNHLDRLEWSHLDRRAFRDAMQQIERRLGNLELALQRTLGLQPQSAAPAKRRSAKKAAPRKAVAKKAVAKKAVAKKAVKAKKATAASKRPAIKAKTATRPAARNRKS